MDTFVAFREEGSVLGGEGEGEGDVREKHLLIASYTRPVLTGDQTYMLGMCPDQGLNLQPFGAWENSPTN